MSFARDVRLAIRRMRRNPLFAVAVAGTLALGVAATTSIYTVVDGILLKPLPFTGAEALVRVTSDFQGINLRDTGLSPPELDDYAKRSGVFSAIAGIWAISANLTGTDRPERIEALLASSNYFDLLGAHAALGRTFHPNDEVPGIATVAVISDGLWRRGFGSDPRIVGRTLRIDEDVYEIIGVMPPSFRHPSQTLETDVEVWAPSGWRAAPFATAPTNSARFMPSAIGRLRPGISIESARVQLESLGRELAREHPDDYPARLAWTPRVYPLAADLVAGVRPALLMLMGGIVFVLLIAISNISNLMLVRAVEREREVAIQRALGASGPRVIVSLLVEGVVLALVGGGVGFLASLWGVDLLLRMVPDRLPRVTDVHVDIRVFTFAVLTSIAAGLLVSLGPALQSARADVIERLKAAGRGLQSGPRAHVRNAFVIAQVAFALVLLAGAALLVRSLWNLRSIDTGMATDRLLTARLWLPQPNEPSIGPYFDHANRVALMRALIERLQGVPEITAAGMATALPATQDSGTTSFVADGWPVEQQELANATLIAVTPGYFPALGMRLVSGRVLTDADDERAARGVVINETLARTYFPNQDPVGRRFHFAGRRGQIPADAPWITIVGVVGDVREDALDAPVRPAMYQSLWRSSSLNLVVVMQGRAAAPSSGVLMNAVRQSDPNLPVFAVRTGEGLLAAQLAQRRFVSTLINAFAGAALLLAAFGLHGVIAYGVRQRTHEIGLRMALGATTGRVMRLVLGEAARLAAIGIAIGLGAAIVLSQLIKTLLFDVRPSDPPTLLGVVLLLSVVVGVATLAAAARATRIEAAVALRHD
jgi:putative ABC transport system permease protein